jgi:hypothetical protein
MKIDEEGSFSEQINAYNDYVKENIENVDKLCDKLVEQILFYKYIINSDYDQSDLVNGKVARNISEIMDRFKDIEEISRFIKEITDYAIEENHNLSWSDFDGLELDKEFKREYNIYKLTKDKE